MPQKPPERSFRDLYNFQALVVLQMTPSEAPTSSGPPAATCPSGQNSAQMREMEFSVSDDNIPTSVSPNLFSTGLIKCDILKQDRLYRRVEPVSDRGDRKLGEVELVPTLLIVVDDNATSLTSSPLF